MARGRKPDSPRKGVFSNDSFGPGIDSPADEVVNDAWEADTPARAVKLARQALDMDLDAVDAYNLLGIHAATLAERVALFREAVRVGERLFAPYLAATASGDADDAGWWGFIGTRPWMRAQHNLGLALLEAGDRKEAADVFKRLLALNPNDNQGIRMLLLNILAEDGEYGACKILFADYPDDIFIEFPATRLLVDLATKKKIDFASHFEMIDAGNPHLLPLIAAAARSNRWPRPPASDMIAWGSKDAAAIYLNEFKAAWLRHPKLLAGFLEAYNAREPRKTKKDPA